MVAPQVPQDLRVLLVPPDQQEQMGLRVQQDQVVRQDLLERPDLAVPQVIQVRLVPQEPLDQPVQREVQEAQAHPVPQDLLDPQAQTGRMALLGLRDQLVRQAKQVKQADWDRQDLKVVPDQQGLLDPLVLLEQTVMMVLMERLGN